MERESNPDLSLGNRIAGSVDSTHTVDTSKVPPLHPRIAHDMRSHINAILLAAQLLEADDESTRSDAASVVRARTQQLSDFVDRLAGTVRSKSGELNRALRAGIRVLLVEDDYFLAQSAAEQLSRAGCEIVGPVGTVESALETVLVNPLDCAVVDANLNGEFAGSVVDLLAAKGVPAIVLSGYDHSALPPSLKKLPLLQKPVSETELVCAVADLFR